MAVATRREPDITPLTPLWEVLSQRHPITKTKLTLVLTLTLISTLTLLILLNPTKPYTYPNCTSKTMKLTSFRQTGPQNDPDDAILVNTLHHG